MNENAFSEDLMLFNRFQDTASAPNSACCTPFGRAGLYLPFYMTGV